MSVEARRWARAQRGLNPSERLVLYNLADECRKGQSRVWKAGADGGPGGVEAIALEEELERRTVQRALRRLEARKIISIERGGGGFRITATYALNMHDNSGVMTLFAETETASLTTPNSVIDDRNSVIDDRNSVITPPSPVIPKGTGKGTGSQNRDSLALERVRGEVVPASSPTAATDDVGRVFAAWAATRTHPNTVKLTDDRRRLIARQLRTYPAADLVDAVQGWQNDPFSRGENDRGTPYNDLALILRDAAHIEKFRDLWRNGATRSEPKMWPALREALANRLAEDKP